MSIRGCKDEFYRRKKNAIKGIKHRVDLRSYQHRHKNCCSANRYFVYFCPSLTDLARVQLRNFRLATRKITIPSQMFGWDKVFGRWQLEG